MYTVKQIVEIFELKSRFLGRCKVDESSHLRLLIIKAYFQTKAFVTESNLLVLQI